MLIISELEIVPDAGNYFALSFFYRSGKSFVFCVVLNEGVFLFEQGLCF